MKLKASYIIILLIVCNLILLYTIHRDRIKAETSLNVLYPYAQKFSFLENNIKHNIKYSSYYIKDTIIEDSIKLSGLFSENKKALFILRLSERYCNSCVKYSLNIMDSIRHNSELPIIYFTGFQNKHRLNFELEDLNLEDKKCYNIPFIETPIDYEGFPYLMVLNKDLMIEYCYFPSKGSDDIDIENINMIIDCYAKKYNVENQ